MKLEAEKVFSHEKQNEDYKKGNSSRQLLLCSGQSSAYTGAPAIYANGQQRFRWFRASQNRTQSASTLKRPAGSQVHILQRWSGSAGKGRNGIVLNCTHPGLSFSAAAWWLQTSSVRNDGEYWYLHRTLNELFGREGETGAHQFFKAGMHQRPLLRPVRRVGNPAWSQQEQGSART
jgi:hypothetical protein